ncbi:PD-(D/E)XK motif protein [Rhodobacter sp. KR11]|uniref:PD-(D/E)XK motif protein n=1 Tax=Rhodobacter sp. KR11 TaxID=2974588 RepID=UPI002222385C|nr:PD-(D/E)XK motif protein [Rhodobacter sp. KR11]MCW1918030.1 PD-(D/E)XK motif protein [Rhodobacter sp. KR11]
MTGWTEEGLIATWRALAKPDGSAWRLLPLARIGAVGIDAGRRFPGSHEALIISFPASAGVSGQGLPEGRGFDIAFLDPYPLAQDQRAIALMRRDEGSEDIFAVICLDLLRCMQVETGGPAEVIETLIERIDDWQSFLARRRRLSPEAQIGLMGELVTLETLLSRGLARATALRAWVGPMRGAQDFHLGSGSMEVKSTASKAAFIARINSVEQLDGERDPQFLRALRFEPEEGADTLVAIVARLRQAFTDAGVGRSFEGLLICAGYLDDHAPHYLRGLRLADARSLRIDADFPRLRRADLPRAIRSASYALDISDLVGESDPEVVFTELGC